MVRNIRLDAMVDSGGSDASLPLLEDWRDKATRAADAALPESRFRCRAHGLLREAPVLLGPGIYCPEEGCNERVLRVGPKATAFTTSAWSKEYDPAKAEKARKQRAAAAHARRESDAQDEEPLEDVGVPAADDAETAEPLDEVATADAEDLVDQVDEPGPELVHPESEAVRGFQGAVDQIPEEAPELVQCPPATAAPHQSTKETDVVKVLETKFERGGARDKLLATLAEAPERTMGYDELSVAIWPGVERKVRLSRLSSTLHRLMAQGHVQALNGKATLLITAPPTPAVAAAAAAPEKRQEYGEARAKLLQALLDAPNRQASYEDLAEAIWPGTSPAVRRPRLNAALTRLARQGIVERSNNVAKLLVDPSAPIPTERRRTTYAQMIDQGRMEPAVVAAAEKAAGAVAPSGFEPMRVALRARITKLHEALEAIDRAEQLVREADAA